MEGTVVCVAPFSGSSPAVPDVPGGAAGICMSTGAPPFIIIILALSACTKLNFLLHWGRREYDG